MRRGTSEDYFGFLILFLFYPCLSQGLPRGAGMRRPSLRRTRKSHDVVMWCGSDRAKAISSTSGSRPPSQQRDVAMPGQSAQPRRKAGLSAPCQDRCEPPTPPRRQRGRWPDRCDARELGRRGRHRSRNGSRRGAVATVGREGSLSSYALLSKPKHPIHHPTCPSPLFLLCPCVRGEQKCSRARQDER